MACLLPPFKCPPDGLSTSCRPSHQPSIHLRTKDPICFQGYCVLSLATSVIDAEEVLLPAVADHLSLATVSSLTYTGVITPPLKSSFGATLAAETFLTDEEALIAAAADEAVAIAKVAVQVAKDAAMSKGTVSVELDDNESFPNKADFPPAATDFLTKHDAIDNTGSISSEIRIGEESTPPCSPNEDNEGSDERDNNLNMLELQLLEGIAARSGRRIERRARRERAAEKNIANVLSMKPRLSSRRKRPSLQNVDYSDPLRYLRRTTSTAKLLTSSEERKLSEGIQDLLKLESLHDELAQRCGGQPSFAQWATAAGCDPKTLQKRINYGTRCKDKMIKNNIRLVISIAKNYQNAGMNLQDLVQEGCRGLARGAEKFDASKGYKFSTYAHWWIKQAVRRSLSDQSRTIRLPFHMVEATFRVKEAQKQLSSKKGRQPSYEEVAEAAGLSMKRLMAVLLAPKAPISLDQKMKFCENLKPLDIIAHPDAETAEDILTKRFMKEDLNRVLGCLCPRESQVIKSRFGLDDGKTKTLQDIGERIGVTRERVRQIESCAFRKLKNKKRTKNLRQYLISS